MEVCHCRTASPRTRMCFSGSTQSSALGSSAEDPQSQWASLARLFAADFVMANRALISGRSGSPSSATAAAPLSTSCCADVLKRLEKIATPVCASVLRRLASEKPSWLSTYGHHIRFRNIHRASSGSRSTAPGPISKAEFGRTLDSGSGMTPYRRFRFGFSLPVISPVQAVVQR